MRNVFVVGNLIILAIVIGLYFIWSPVIWTLAILAPFTLLGLYDIFQKKHSILRNFPVLGHFRFLFEMIAPELHQYFVEGDTDGKPIDRNHRAYIYQRAKLQTETHPFGTELDVTLPNYEYMHHSIYPAKKQEELPRITVGGPDCKHPYSASIFNISAMSYGALSKNAVMALNIGAREGNFFHDTGEGSISPYHLHGGDLVYEIGTGYFGCRSDDGNFSPEKYKAQAAKKEVKMIEIKISQGAKPGHGGVLPAAKNNKEIAEIRGVEPHTTVLSPPGHSAFNNAEGLCAFIKQLRDLSDGKPVGFKLAIGNRDEFVEICEAMLKTGIKPDFITVDGAEGGTGAAPIDFSNYVGMPWEEALVFVVDTLNGFDLKKDIKVLTATKIFTAFDIYKAISIGADICNSARGMMLALGCIQALKCDTNECPTGVTTNKPHLMKGLVVSEKWKRVKNYHHETLKDFMELLAASGNTSTEQLNRSHVYKRSFNNNLLSFEEIYPSQAAGSFLKN
ncbi:FMN-binding glutamate synthase family protein [Fulvivirga ligni]|uniref:FMN-binding glutamate synthase family protein n=1 Tax=Fulvivirga ligni TaxID=2904246 RepID=UPI001F3AC4AD|nr:FMN-binding glutamate synthase family protein [Fulvivirga ligni]UII21677.1 FMN-binding glutamate synthase family protein [Fulvivirga ligni]